MVYWRGDHFFIGKLLEHPEIMTQGETLEELEENLKDAYLAMVLEDVPDRYQTKGVICEAHGAYPADGAPRLPTSQAR
jgi:predicted RNase H-like HicB family nuclease